MAYLNTEEADDAFQKNIDFQNEMIAWEAKKMNYQVSIEALKAVSESIKTAAQRL